MNTFLRFFFCAILASMIGVTVWASLQCPLFGVPRAVATHPWFLATLADAYFGFLTFYVWVAYRESHWGSKIAWFIAIMLLGNLAMASYCLSVLLRAKKDESLAQTAIAKQPGLSPLGIIGAVLGITVLFLA